jgi:hypothetical protein
MTWNPTIDPVCPDATSADLIETLIIPRPTSGPGWMPDSSTRLVRSLTHVARTLFRARNLEAIIGSHELGSSGLRRRG